MKRIIVGLIFLASLGLVNNVSGQVAAPLITPGNSQANPAVNFWNEAFTANISAGNGSSKNGPNKVKGDSRSTGVLLSGKSSMISFLVNVGSENTDYDDFSTSSNNFTNYSNDTNSQEIQIAVGAESAAIGLDFSESKSDETYKIDSISSYDNRRGSTNTVGISLQFSEVYLGYYSGKNSIKRKVKSSNSIYDFPNLTRNYNGFGIGFLLRSKFDIHAEIYNLSLSDDKVYDGDTIWGTDEAKSSGITLEILAGLLNFGLVYQKTSYKENLFPEFLEDYERERIATIIGFSFTENINLGYGISTDKYEQKFKDSSEINTYFDETSSSFSISYIFR